MCEDETAVTFMLWGDSRHSLNTASNQHRAAEILKSGVVGLNQAQVRKGKLRLDKMTLYMYTGSQSAATAVLEKFG